MGVGEDEDEDAGEERGGKASRWRGSDGGMREGEKGREGGGGKKIKKV